MPTRTLAPSTRDWFRRTLERRRRIARSLERLVIAIVTRNDPLHEAGEGVVSTAIIVVIMAFLAVGLWFAFKTIMANATTTVSNQVAQLGS
ncbi:hypothetical protein Afer_1281 [Acidimicrobium ferrooxidans DSM 10331]|uniref:Uncharacterized protein n=1 Tax=Acidimicrobium ferrooxidans (strain DSM 10331 / JCM 15462 / NBRC 103882 / ICP) TaxID=525909 RepID=C7LZQ3_ACIFD|nr:hypothetical protein [Acidimicrobium ferrooxidans]ACU54211.1 hypothetical protein Afer_1281 [Acidimicrobium ferrooxidans DSM 10331]